MDKLTAIKSFQAVVKLRSFSQAARELRVSPQLLSKYVSALERDLGMRLLNRTTRRLNLTSEGAAYYEESLRIVEALDALEERLADLRLNPSGVLRLSAPVSLGKQRLGSMLAEFLALYPDMAIDVQLNDRKVDIIDEGFDLALRIGTLADSSLVARQLAPVDILACASPAYVQRHGAPVHLAQLAQHTVLRYAYLAGQSDLAGTHAPLISNSGELLAQAACAGAGVVLTPRFMVQQALEAGDLVELFALPAQRQLALYALYPHRTMVPLKLRVFVDFLAEQFAKQPL